MAKIFDTYKGEADKDKLNIHDYLVDRPASTFFLRLDTDGPEGSGAQAGDVLVVDRSRLPKNNDLLIVNQGGDMVIVYFKEGIEAEEMELWGVVTGLVRKF